MRCSVCGYSLVGVGAGQVISECPECGAPFDPGDGSRPRRWPPTWRIALGLCGGMLLLGALFLVAWVARRSAGGSSEFANVLIYILQQCVLPIWFFSPILAAVLLARRYAYRGERWMVGLGLTVAGIVGNTVLALGAMLVAIIAA
ncbi:MAG: hypothetical protein AB7O77_03285 [Phycisphaerales bacterium]